MSVNNPNLFLDIVEPPEIVIFYAAGEPMEEMMVVTLRNDGMLYKATSADTPFGFVTQDVTTTGISDQSAINGLISRTAKVGDKVGVYMGTAILKTDKYIGTIQAGTKLYCHSASGGYLTNTSGGQVVGIADGAPNNGVIRFKSLI